MPDRKNNFHDDEHNKPNRFAANLNKIPLGITPKDNFKYSPDEMKPRGQRHATHSMVAEVMREGSGNPLAQKYSRLAGEIGSFVRGPRVSEMFTHFHILLSDMETARLTRSAMDTFSIIPRDFIEKHGDARIAEISSNNAIRLITRALENGPHPDNIYDFEMLVSLLRVVAKYLEEGSRGKNKKQEEQPVRQMERWME